LKERKYKIALVANSTWNFYNFRLNVLKAMVENGYEVVIISPADEYLEFLLEKLSVRHIPLRHLDRKGINPVRELLLFRELKKIYQEESPDLIFHYTIKPNIYGSLAAGKLRIRSIAVTTGLGYAFTHSNVISFSARLLYKIALKHSRQVWFLNEDDKSVFLENGLISEEKAKVLRGEGVDTDYFSPIPSTRDHSDTKMIFLLSARMIFDKGIREFVDAVSLLNKKGYNVEGVLVGFLDEDNPKSIPMDLIKKWQSNGSINFLGKTADIRPYIANADCVVLPSFYREGIPRILLEASSMEKPIITSDQVGCKEVVDDNITGLICKKRDVKSLVAAMEKMLLMSPDERTRMGRSGRLKTIKEFDDQLIISTYLHVLAQFNIANKESLALNGTS